MTLYIYIYLNGSGAVVVWMFITRVGTNDFLKFFTKCWVENSGGKFHRISGQDTHISAYLAMPTTE